MDISPSTEELDREYPHTHLCSSSLQGRVVLVNPQFLPLLPFTMPNKVKRTILVSSDPAHSTDDVLGEKVGFSPDSY